MAREEGNSESDKVQEVVEEPDFKPCNCTSSGCLKLYCECFKNNRYCGEHCRCSCCRNSTEHEQMRLKAKEMILMRNPFAFRSKIQASKLGNIIESVNAHEADVIT